LALANLNKTEMPGFPHILIYTESFEKAKYGTELLKSRKLIKDILGGEDIVKWVKSGLSLEE
ncbi:MAG: hypothetical protein M1480_15710, partial [Bacteroidetes bacterium]|nr:hypothetical protein [Bacteroidota bacterium]